MHKLILLCLMLLHCIGRCKLEETTARATSNTALHTWSVNSPKAADDKYKSQGMEEHFIQDLISNTRSMTHIFINCGLHTMCEHTICEKYSLTTEEQLKKMLRPMTYKLKDGKEYAPETNLDAVIVKFAHGSTSSYRRSLTTSIRYYHKRCYIVILTDDDVMLQRVKEILLTLKMFNVYIASRDNVAEMYRLYEVCAFCNHGTTELKLYNIWKMGGGFTKEMKFQRSFKDEFFGASLTIGIFPVKPCVFEVSKNDDGTIIYAGSDYMTLQTLAKQLNFHAIIKRSYSSVDIAGFPGRYNGRLSKHYDHTAMYYVTGNVIVSRKPPMKSDIVSAVSPVVLVMILVSYLASAISYCLITRYFYKEPKSSFLDLLVWFFAILSLESIGVRVRNMRTGQIIILGVWMIISFFGISVIFAEITAISASPEVPQDPINSYQDMIQRKISWITHESYMSDKILLQMEEIADVMKNNRKYMTIKEGLQYVLRHPDEYVYYIPRETIDPIINQYFLNPDGTSPFHISPIVTHEPYTCITVFVTKDAPYRQAIAMKLLQLDAAGLPSYKFLSDAQALLGGRRKQEIKKESEKFTSPDMKSMFMSFLIIPIGLFCSVLVFAVEIIVDKIILKIILVTMGKMLLMIGPTA